MREIFSVRFFAAVGGVIGLFFLLTTVFATREVIEGGDAQGDAAQIRRIEFVAPFERSSNPDFGLDDDGLAIGDTSLVIDDSRALTIVTGTPGVDHCPRLGQGNACAVVADLLGEGVVWFAFVPSSGSVDVDLPAIDTLDDGLATLVNGWQLPYAPVLDRRCDDDFESYVQFRNVLGDNFTSVYGVEDRRLVAVECRERVPYAPGAATRTSP